jgi:5-methylcytosine-specific restriction endonuclease McrA
VGYTVGSLAKHLESQFDDKMSWNNYGKYWHIDHIIPKSWFSYEDVKDKDFQKCWALNNLQPLEAMKNLSKNNRYIG